MNISRNRSTLRMSFEIVEFYLSIYAIWLLSGKIYDFSFNLSVLVSKNFFLKICCSSKVSFSPQKFYTLQPANLACFQYVFSQTRYIGFFVDCTVTVDIFAIT